MKISVVPSHPPQGVAMQRPLRAQRAFTMVEIALCLAVIGFALVAIIGVLPIGMGVQKANREETIINFDAKYLMDAIRSGAVGSDELTNYIVSITNNFWVWQVTATTTNVQGPFVNWYNNFTNPPPGSADFYSINGAVHTTPYLTNGSNIIGLLSTPKITPLTPQLPSHFKTATFVSNFITADFRAITGSPVDQGSSGASHDLAFTYRLFPEIIPFSVPDASMMNPALALNLQNNLSEIRLRFRWPILPSGATASGTQVYRTAASGAFRPGNNIPQLYYFQPQGYVANTSTNLLP